MRSLKSQIHIFQEDFGPRYFWGEPIVALGGVLLAAEVFLLVCAMEAPLRAEVDQSGFVCSYFKDA